LVFAVLPLQRATELDSLQQGPRRSRWRTWGKAAATGKTWQASPRCFVTPGGAMRHAHST